MEREIPAWIVARLRKINKIAWWLYAIHYLLGGLSIILTITIASKLTFIDSNKNVVPLLAWLASIFVGLNTFIRPSEKAKIYRETWLELKIACSRYLSDTQYTLKELENAFKYGWKNIIRTVDKISKQH